MCKANARLMPVFRKGPPTLKAADSVLKKVVRITVQRASPAEEHTDANVFYCLGFSVGSSVS